MPSWTSFGAAAAVSTQVQAAYPTTGITSASKLFYLIGTNSSITTAPAAPSGWTLSGAMVSTGTQKVLAYEKDTVTGSETGNGPLITGFTAGTVGAASIVCISPTTGGNTLVTSTYSTGTDTTSNTAYSVAGASWSPTTADLILGFSNAIATGTAFASSATATLSHAGATISQTSRFIGRTGSNTVNYNCNTASVTTGGTGAPTMAATLNQAGTGSALFLRITEVSVTAKSGTEAATVSDSGSMLSTDATSGTDTFTATDSPAAEAIIGVESDSTTVSDAITGAVTLPGSDSATQSDATAVVLGSNSVSGTDSATQSDAPGSVSGSGAIVVSDSFGFADSASLGSGIPVPTFRDSVSDQGGSTTSSFTITIPGTVVDGDYGLIIGAAGSGSNASDTPAGWDVIKADVQIGTGRYVIYGRRYVTGDSNPTLNYPTAPTSGNNISYLAAWWSECAGIDVSGSNVTNPAAQFTNNAAGLTSARDGDLFVGIGWQKGSGSGFASTVGVAPDVTLRASRLATGNFYSSLAIADFAVPTAATVGDQTFTWDFSTANGAGFSLLLRNTTVDPDVPKVGNDALTLSESQQGLQTRSVTESSTFSDSSAAPVEGSFPSSADVLTQSDSSVLPFSVNVSVNNAFGFADVATMPGPPVGADPFVRATAKATGASTVTSHTIVTPGSVVPGDWGFILADAGNGSGATTTPAGWTVVIPSTQVSGQRIALYARQFQAGDGNTVVNWPTAPASGNNTGVLAIWIGNCEGYDVVGSLTNNVNASNVTSAASLNTAEANALVLAWSAIKGSSTGFPSTVAWAPDAVEADTLVATATYNVGLSVATFLQPSVGATQAQTATWDFSTTSATGFQLSINPVGAGLGVKAGTDTFSLVEDGNVDGSSVEVATDSFEAGDRHISRLITDTVADLIFTEDTSTYTSTQSTSDTSMFTDISQQTTIVFASDLLSLSDQPGAITGGSLILAASESFVTADVAAMLATGVGSDSAVQSENSLAALTFTLTASNGMTQTEIPVAIFVPRSASDTASGSTESSFVFLVGSSNFTLWNGTVEIPLDLLGQWNGTSLVPIVFEGTV